MVIFDFSCFETDDDLTLNSTDGSEVGFQNKEKKSRITLETTQDSLSLGHINVTLVKIMTAS